MTDLEIRGLTVEYVSGDYVVRPVESLDADARSGELVLLLGPSGSGKTTVLSCLAGILRPSAGTVTLGETVVSSLAGTELTVFRRDTVGIAFQSFNLIPSLTALENVDAPLRAAGIPGRTARARAEALLEEVGLADRASHRPDELSGGQQQRVAIARALAADPRLVLADEPTAHLDYVQVEGILRLLRTLARPGRLVVVSTHDERLVPLADRVIDLAPALETVAAGPQRVTLSAGETLFEQGSRGGLIYVVEEGEVELTRSRSDGSEELLGISGTGEYFGELAPLLGFQRAATARAREAAVVTGYTVSEFRGRMGGREVAELIRS